jgi:hypothetical protein
VPNSYRIKSEARISSHRGASALKMSGMAEASERCGLPDSIPLVLTFLVKGGGARQVRSLAAQVLFAFCSRTGKLLKFPQYKIERFDRYGGALSFCSEKTELVRHVLAA